MFFVLAVSAAQIQNYLSLFELLHYIVLDLFDDFVMKIKAKAVVSLLNIFFLNLKRLHFLELTRMELAHVLSEQRIVPLHGFLVVALRVTVEVIRAFAGCKLDLSKSQRYPS